MSDLADMINRTMEKFDVIKIVMTPNGPFVSMRRKGTEGYQCDQMQGQNRPPAEHLEALMKLNLPPEKFDILEGL